MKLTQAGISEKQAWEAKSYRLPAFDQDAMKKETQDAPVWVHFGGGNLFRAFHAALAQDMLEQGLAKQGVIVVEGFDYEIVEKSYWPHDNISVLVTLKSDGSLEKRVIGSVADSYVLDSENDAQFGGLKAIFANPALQMSTFTITEKGYSLVNGAGETTPAVLADFEAGPTRPATYIGKVAALLYARYQAGAYPIAMVSTDNCSHNGDKLHAAVSAFAKAWTENGTADAGFAAYIENPEKVSFPWSMIDKITPRPDASVEQVLLEDGLEEAAPIVTSRGTYIASFVNAEETQYLVIEDRFPNGRPALDQVGVIFTDRETVDKVEKMKVCTCLNPLHTALAVFGCVLGYTRISDEMKDADLVKLVERIGYQEGLPVVVNPGVLDPKAFIDTVLQVRVPNPFMPDTPQRIATDTSQKLPIRFGETIRKYQENQMDLSKMQGIPLVFAAWIRYLMGIDDQGQKFELSSDPMLDTVCPVVADVKLGDVVEDAKLRPLLENTKIWGVDLYAIGMAQTVLDRFNEMNTAPGAVRTTLQKVIAE